MEACASQSSRKLGLIASFRLHSPEPHNTNKRNEALLILPTTMRNKIRYISNPQVKIATSTKVEYKQKFSNRLPTKAHFHTQYLLTPP